ncbi:uncharacterized protein LOC143810141 [Ranitomeya variabilis]|uniref:uncharacterized protein LOC143810141 n=1 Tax=Ranitomeya variabilis TaxID=490064 RepID=UPI004055B938
MLFGFVLIVCMLLASFNVEPDNIRRHDPWPKHWASVNIRLRDSWQKHAYLDLDGIVPTKIPWKACIIYVVLLITMYLLQTFIGVICKIIWRHLIKDTPRRDDESDEARVTTAKRLGYHKDPRRPWAEKRDKLKNIRLPPGRVSDMVAKFEAHQNAIANSDRNFEAPRGPLAEKRDKLKYISIPPGRVSDMVAKFEAHQNPIANSDRHQEDKKHIPPTLFVFIKVSERPNGFSEDEARPSQNRQ